ncbi:MAG TPA: hypothetical protein VIX20_11840, partial [Ktedonobacteraceae bacterium]
IFIAVLTLLAAFIAGMRASLETGRTTTGTLAGLWTGMIGLLILSLIALGFLLLNLDGVRKSAQITANQQHLHITYTNSQIITNYLFVYIVLIALGILFGVIGGFVGGIFSSRRAQIPPVEVYQEAMFEPSASETEESPSETPSEEPSSSTQQAE